MYPIPNLFLHLPDIGACSELVMQLPSSFWDSPLLVDLTTIRKNHNSKLTFHQIFYKSITQEKVILT